MAVTINRELKMDDGWQKIRQNPDAITIRCNVFDKPDHLVTWFVAVTEVDSAPTIMGEVHRGASSWIAGEITGYVWLKSVSKMNFAITYSGGA